MFNRRVLFRNARVIFMVVSLCLPGWASAAEIEWLPQQSNNGLTVMIPSIDLDTLVDEMVAMKVKLKQNERVLAHRVEDKRVTGNDKVLAFIMPGGMLYTAYKKSAYNKAIKEHEQVSEQIEEITSDIVALTTTRGTIAVAQR